jgi:translation initiation factor 2B subunit (eIF-2B alpha/beta/delta family)
VQKVWWKAAALSASWAHIRQVCCRCTMSCTCLISAAQIATVAKAFGKAVYVAAESYKFARLFPLTQRDLPTEAAKVDFGPALPESVTVENPSRDYTPPHLITLLFTDLGVLTPSAVSDELIQAWLYSRCCFDYGS